MSATNKKLREANSVQNVTTRNLPLVCSPLAKHQGHPKYRLKWVWLRTSSRAGASTQKQRAWTLEVMTVESSSQVTVSRAITSSTNVHIKRPISGWLEPNQSPARAQWPNRTLSGSSLIISWIGQMEDAEDLYNGLPYVLNMLDRSVHSSTPVCWRYL